MKRSIICAAFAAAACSAPALAENYTNYFTVGSSHASNEKTSGYFSDTEYNIHSYTFEASLGFQLDNDNAFELTYISPNLQKKARPDIDQLKMNFFHFFGEDELKPYITAGLGRERFEVPGEDVIIDLVLGVGAGLQYDFTDRFFGRAEIRFDDPIRTRPEHRVYGLEIGMRFGETAPVTKPEPMPEPEPAPAPVVVVPPADTDNDGVIDDKDMCADTPSTVTVDAKGCPEYQGGQLEGVKFETNSANLTLNSQTILDEAAEELKTYPELDIEVAAYTDSMGADSYNLMLSQKRAESVMTYLVSKGVNPAQLTAKGYGEANPIATNDTAAGRAENRRVELVVK